MDYKRSEKDNGDDDCKNDCRVSSQKSRNVHGSDQFLFGHKHCVCKLERNTTFVILFGLSTMQLVPEWEWKNQRDQASPPTPQ